MTRPLGVIGVPSSAGSYAPGQEQAPRALRDVGLLAQLEATGLELIDHGDAPVWRWAPDRASPRAQNAEAVAACAAATAERVRIALAAGDWPLVLGGDCTVGVGTYAGHLPGDDRVGLVYLDLHGDLNTPDTVIDGALDWMGVAHLLGEEGATPGLRDFGPRTPLLEDDQIVLLGFDAGQATAGERERIERR
ncbi:MAG TPA: arginase family protein, partial [Gaiellales bacterium]